MPKQNDNPVPPSEPKLGSSVGVFASNADLFLACIITFATVTFIFAPYLKDTIIRTVLGYLTIFFIPGYVLLAAVFPDRGHLSLSERIPFSIALSIIAAPLVGFFLNYSPWGVVLDSVVVCLTGEILVASAVAYWRRSQLPPHKRFSLNLSRAAVAGYFGAAHTLPGRERRANRQLTLGLIVFVVASALLLSFVVLAPQSGKSITELYVLNSKGEADNYPTQLQLGKAENFVVGVSNSESANARYTLKVALSNGTQQNILYSNQLALGSKETWQQSVAVKPDLTGKNLKLQFLLYRGEDTSAAYLENHLWVSVVPS